MAESGFTERYHVPQQSRRDKLRIVAAAAAASHNQQLQSVFLPSLDPANIPSDLITCVSTGAAGLHHPGAGSKEESHSHSFMGYAAGGVGGGGRMISSAPFSSSTAATNHELYVDPQLSVQLNPSPIPVQDITGSNNPFLYSPQSLKFLQQSFHGGGEVMVYRPEPVSVGHHHGPNPNNNDNNRGNNTATTTTNDKSSNSNGHNTCGQGLSLSLSSHHSRSTNLPIQRYDAAEVVFSTAGCFLPAGANAHDVSNSNELLLSSRSSVPLGPFTGYASVLKGSRFLKPSQQLLEELCDVGRGVYADKMAVNDSILLDSLLECFSASGIANGDDPRSCIDGSEKATRKKKSRLMSMLNEVYQRYKQYYQQMQAVISSFESVAGVKNAAPFASLALKAMSKHFRCLKNAIAEQLQLMIEARGHVTNDTDTAPGFEYSGTGFHCQRPPQNTGLVEPQPVWRPQRGLPERAVTVLRSWLFEHFLHPYPTDTDKLMLAKQTGLSRNQVSNWFINARVRLWKPMVEEIHMLETRQVQKGSQREDQENDDRRNDPMPRGINPTSYENISSSTSKRFRELGSKRSRNDLAVIPAGNGTNVATDLTYQNSASSSHVPSAGFGVSKADGSTGGVSLTLGLHQNNSLGFADMFQMNAARRFGLDAADGGGDYRQFGREIAGGHLLHDFVG